MISLDFLLNRVHYKKYLSGNPFYSLYDIKSYTYKTYKVVWKYIASELTCCVISETIDPYLEKRLILPDNKLILVPSEDENEAHYICCLLNSSISRLIVNRYVVSTQIAPHILKNIKIPKYSNKNSIHSQLSALSKQCHEAVSKGDTEILKKLEIEVDKMAAKLWNISDNELVAIQNALKDMVRPKKQMRQKSQKNKDTKKDKPIENPPEPKEAISTGGLLQDKVTPEDLMHLSHKAKYNNLLTPKQRSALYKICQLKYRGYQLSQKQIDYLESIIIEALAQGILDAKCNSHECEICNKLCDIFNK